MKKTLLILILAILVTGVISALFFTQPVQDLVQRLPFTEDLYSKGSLVVNSRNGISTVLIDGEEFGETPLELADIDPGSHTITLSRALVEEDSFYNTQTFFIELEPNTEAIIDIELGPRGAIAGYVLYYNQAPSRQADATISVNADPKGSNLFLDGEFISSVPVYSETLSDGDHTITVEHELYEDVSFPIVARDGFNLNITVYQLPIPLNIETAKANEQ